MPRTQRSFGFHPVDVEATWQRTQADVLGGACDVDARVKRAGGALVLNKAQHAINVEADGTSYKASGYVIADAICLVVV